MKADWQVKPLNSLAALRPAKRESREHLADNEAVSFVPMDCLNTGRMQLSEHISKPLGDVYSGYTYFADGDVLLAKITPCFENGKLGIAKGLTNGVGFGSSEFFVIRPGPNLLAKYLYYYLDRQEFRDHAKSKMTGAVGHKRVPKELLDALPIALPPLEEQQRIVAILDAAFEGLDRARAHAKANLKNARELFENYREDYLDPSKRQGWSFRKLDDLIIIKHGFAFKSAFFADRGQYAVLTPGNYHETGGFRARGEKQKYYFGEFPPEFLLNKGDLLMAMTEQAPGLLGSCMIVPENDGFLHNQRLGLITPKMGVAWAPEYFAQAFNLKAFRKGLSDTCSGATVRHTSPSRILAECIPHSNDLSELKIAARDLADREQDCLALECAYRGKLQDLSDLRQSLLQKAFAGELTAKEFA